MKKFREFYPLKQAAELLTEQIGEQVTCQDLVHLARVGKISLCVNTSSLPDRFIENNSLILEEYESVDKGIFYYPNDNNSEAPISRSIKFDLDYGNILEIIGEAERTIKNDLIICEGYDYSGLLIVPKDNINELKDSIKIDVGMCLKIPVQNNEFYNELGFILSQDCFEVSIYDCFVLAKQLENLCKIEEIQNNSKTQQLTAKDEEIAQLKEEIENLKKYEVAQIQAEKLEDVKADTYNPKERETHLKLIYALTMARTNKDFSASAYFNNKGILKPYTMMNDLISDFEESGIQGFSADSLRKKLSEILKMEELQAE